LIVTLIVFASTATALANQLSNGDFEAAVGAGNGGGNSSFGLFTLYNAPNQGIPNWTLISGSIEAFTNYRGSGSTVLDMTGLHTAFPGAGPGTIEQTFTTAVTTVYNVTFLMGGAATPARKEMEVSVVGSSGLLYQSIFAFDVNSVAQAGDLVPRGFSFTGDGGFASVRFRSLVNDTFDGPYLDDVVIISIPEPSSDALLITGLIVATARARPVRNRRNPRESRWATCLRLSNDA
jgi:hypothetical protein